MGYWSDVDVIDDDTFASASPVNVPSAESVAAYVDSQVVGSTPPSYVGRVLQTLTDKLSFAGTGSEQWGTEEATFNDGSLPVLTGVIVYAAVSGYVLNMSSAGALVLFVEISLDGGSTWDTGRQQLLRKDTGAGANDRVSAHIDHQVTGTVTGDIQARAMASCSTGAAAAYDLLGGAIALEVVANP